MCQMVEINTLLFYREWIIVSNFLRMCIPRSHEICSAFMESPLKICVFKHWNITYYVKETRKVLLPQNFCVYLLKIATHKWQCIGVQLCMVMPLAVKYGFNIFVSLQTEVASRVWFITTFVSTRPYYIHYIYLK